MLQQLSLRTRSLILSVLLVALPAAICVGILVHVGGIRIDADRLMEETRESGLANRLLVCLESLQAVVADGVDMPPGSSLHAFASAQVHEGRRLLAEIEGVPPALDPSRPEHQRAESDLLRTVAGVLEGTSAWLADASSSSIEDVIARLEFGRTHAALLAEETWRESALTDRDVERRALASQRYVLISLITVVLACCAGLLLVFRTVLTPIRDLRRGAERLRGGDLAHRIEVEGHDEIAELGHALNALADEVHRSHEELQQKVETRTRELLHAARLADVGLFAAGLAHEINTPLASIASCGEGLLRRIDAGTLERELEREYLATIVSEAYRTRDITRRLLDLARPAPASTTAVDVGQLFRQAERLTAHLLAAKSLRLEVELRPGLPAVDGDPGELLQALLNLVLNARDASPERGRIRLCARTTEEGQVWEIEDEGAGIPAEQLERVFDPFFSTKEPGVGTGLGLSLVAAIVDRHRGTIRADNVEGGGARFSLRLPRGREAA